MKGILCVNLGTPDQCDPLSVRRYLKAFLNDPKVIDLPAFIRWPLVNLIIIPRRYKASAHAYQKIWLPEGSPLLVNSRLMAEGLQKSLPDEYRVALGMRYGNPSIKNAVEQLAGCTEITVLPLFPQYANASTGSAVAKSLEVIKKQWGKQFNNLKLNIIKDFYQHPAFIAAYQAVIAKNLNNLHTSTDTKTKIIFSYHGLPERHLNQKNCYQNCVYLQEKKGGCHTNNSTLATTTDCYRGQCYTTSYLLANALTLNEDQYHTAFQSRLGRTPWIKPYTDLLLPELAQKGVEHLVMVSPSFIADCLETLEEINIRTQEQWLMLGGKSFTTVPCLNGEKAWIEALVKILSR